MKNYFVYRLKKCLAPFLVIAFAGFLGYVLPVAIDDGNYIYCASYISNISFVLGAACTVLPVWAFAYKMDKRSTDLFYSLPITRGKLFAVHFITGFLTIIAAYTAAYLLGFIVFAIKFGTQLKLVYFLCLYLSSLIPAYIIYSISSFAYTRANSAADGVAFIIFAMLAVFAVAVFISNFTSYKQINYYEVLKEEGGYDRYAYTTTENYIDYTQFFPYTALSCVSMAFERLIIGKTVGAGTFGYYGDYTVISLCVSLGLFAVISALLTAAMLRCERNCKAENCNQVSESPFGYKVMVPLFLLVICSTFGKYWTDDAEMIILLAVLVAAAYALTAFYKKTFKIGWKAGLALACAVVLGIVVSYLSPGII